MQVTRFLAENGGQWGKNGVTFDNFDKNLMYHVSKIWRRVSKLVSKMSFPSHSNPVQIVPILSK
jgi:capsid protein